MSNSGDLRLGCFRVLSEIKRGAGERDSIYKAVCETDGFDGVAVGTMVALKVVEIADDDHGARLQSRALELVKLVHHGIERCWGYFAEEPDQLRRLGVFVFEWLDGETLEDRLHREPHGLDADETLRIGEKLLSALAYVSSVGVFHRNLKPDNVFKPGNVFLCANGEVKIVDCFRPQPTDEHTIPPCVHKNVIYDYLAPEFHPAMPDYQGVQFVGDEQSDIFSLGVCLHEMLTGRLPYQPADGRSTDGDKVFEFMSRWHRANEGDDPILIHSLVNRLLAGAKGVLAKALRPKRAERYETFADFLAAFKGIHFRELTHGENTWRLLQYVGRGGFGEVFKARDVKTGQFVAIKRLCWRQYVNWFRREARIISRLNEPTIVRFVDFFEKELDDRMESFLVMEYLDGMPGRSLRDELKRAEGKPLPRNLVIRAFEHYAHGLSVMHAKGLVHRDIKPSKLYFPSDGIDRALIMSSTIFRDMSDTITAGAVRGTLDYMPPEVVVSESRGDAGMDVYALGLCLYESLSGETAYPCLPTGMRGFVAFVARVKNRIMPNLDESSYSDMPDLVRLVREMTEPDVAKRLNDAAEVERRLRALSDKALVQHDQPCPVYGCPKYRGVRMLLGELWDDVKACMRVK